MAKRTQLTNQDIEFIINQLNDLGTTLRSHFLYQKNDLFSPLIVKKLSQQYFVVKDIRELYEASNPPYNMKTIKPIDPKLIEDEK